MDKLELLGLNLGRVFNSRSVLCGEIHQSSSTTKLSNLELKTAQTTLRLSPVRYRYIIFFQFFVAGTFVRAARHLVVLRRDHVDK